MSNCTKYEDLCSVYVDGRLTSAEETELIAHLQECSECAEYLETLKVMGNAFHELDMPIPDTLHETIMSAVRKDAASRTVQYRQPKHRAPVLTMVAAAVAAVVLVVSGGLGDITNFSRIFVFGDDAHSSASTESTEGTRSTSADASSSNVTEAPATGGAAQSKAAPKLAMAAPENASQDTALAPPTASAEAITIPPDIASESYAFCVIARGTGTMPEMEGTLVSGTIGGSQAFFTVKNSMTLLEKLLDTLSKAGYEPTVDQNTLVAEDKDADTGLVILIKDS